MVATVGPAARTTSYCRFWARPVPTTPSTSTATSAGHSEACSASARTENGVASSPPFDAHHTSATSVICTTAVDIIAAGIVRPPRSSSDRFFFTQVQPRP